MHLSEQAVVHFISEAARVWKGCCSQFSLPHPHFHSFPFNKCTRKLKAGFYSLSAKEMATQPSTISSRERYTCLWGIASSQHFPWSGTVPWEWWQHVHGSACRIWTEQEWGTQVKCLGFARGNGWALASESTNNQLQHRFLHLRGTHGTETCRPKARLGHTGNRTLFCRSKRDQLISLSLRRKLTAQGSLPY